MINFLNIHVYLKLKMLKKTFRLKKKFAMTAFENCKELSISSMLEVIKTYKFDEEIIELFKGNILFFNYFVLLCDPLNIHANVLLMLLSLDLHNYYI